MCVTVFIWTGTYLLIVAARQVAFTEVGEGIEIWDLGALRRWRRKAAVLRKSALLGGISLTTNN